MSSIISKDHLDTTVLNLKDSLTHELQIKRLSIMSMITQYHSDVLRGHSIINCKDLETQIRSEISKINQKNPQTEFFNKIFIYK